MNAPTRVFFLLLFCVIALGGCSATVPVKQEPFIPRPVVQSELNSVAEALSRSGTRRYVHFSSDRGPSSLVRGLFLMRDPSRFQYVGNGLFDDGQGNLVHFGIFDAPRDETVHYAITFSPRRDVILALDRMGDGVVDVLIGQEALANRFWILGANEWRSFSRCFGGQTADGRSPFASVANCLESDTDDGGSEAPSIGQMFSGFIGEVAEPDCKDDPLSRFAEPTESERADTKERDYRKAADHHRAEAEEARERGDTESEEHHEEAAEDYESAADAAGDLSDALESGDEKTIEEARDALEDAEFDVIIGELARGEAPPERGEEPRESWWQRWSSTPAGDPLTGPTGRSDPRCPARDLEASWGILSRNPGFCGDDDMITCLRKEADPIRGITGGRCRTDVGPDDAVHLVCEKPGRGRAGREPRDPNDLGDDLAPLPFEVGTDQKLHTGYIEVTPLGGVIAVHCKAAQGGLCETPPRPEPPGEGMRN